MIRWLDNSNSKEAPLPSLKDQVVIITGAASGIGRETARLLAAERAKTVVSDIQAEPLEETAAIVRDLGGETVAVATDVSSREQVDRMVQTAIDTFGRVDILVNNAAYGYGALAGDVKHNALAIGKNEAALHDMRQTYQTRIEQWARDQSVATQKKRNIESGIAEVRREQKKRWPRCSIG